VLLSFRDAEEPDLIVVRELVQPGTIAVDLGANIGTYTKVLSDLVGPAGTVISVEPVPQTFEVLSRIVQSLGMCNVSCINAAISDSDGEVVMELPNYDTGGINFYQAKVVASSEKRVVGSRRQVVVPALRLDTLVGETGIVGFVKCDVEGHELACLSGAEMVLNSHSPAWLVEVWGDPDEPGTKAMQLFGIFEGLSYVPWWFDGHRLVNRQPGERSTNYFFLKDAHSAMLRDKAPQLFEVVRTPSMVRTS
jgi:FkbM family methyltransferase